MQTVDILLPTYNGAAYVSDQIKSLLAQTHSDIKIFIRDDGSTDDTCKIIGELASLDPRVILIGDSIGNLGLVNNVNLLMGFSNANYLMYCDQDDVWFPEKVEVLLNELVKAEARFGDNIPMLVHSDAYVTDENLKGKKLFKGKAPLKYGLRNSLFKYYVQGASSIFNRSLKDKIFPFIDGIYLHDRYTHLIAEVLGRRIYIDKPLMYYRQHIANLVGSSNFLQKVRNNLKLANIDFYLPPDKFLIENIFKKKIQGDNLIPIYLKITSIETSKFEKIKLLFENRIPIRLKDLIVLLIKNNHNVRN